MRRIISFGALASMVVLFGVTWAPAAEAPAGGQPNTVLDYEAMFVSLDPDGSARNVQFVDTLNVVGNGAVQITDATPTADFRNRSGTGGTEVGENRVTWDATIDGSAELVSSGTPDVPPPLSMLATYHVNGERVEPDNLVGADGAIEMFFDITNTTSQPQTITYEDGSGRELTAQEDVPIPLAAQIQLVLPRGDISGVEAEGAEIVTEPNGDLLVVWNTVFMPPVGSLTQTFSVHVRQAEDFRLGEFRVIGSPISPSQREYTSYASDVLGGDNADALSAFSGATQIGENLDAVHEGSLELLDGMKQLLAGSQELTTGLGRAASGSGELASGLGDASEGSGLISGGLASLQSGLSKILAGLKQLKAGLPAAQTGTAGIQAIAASLDENLTNMLTGVNGIVSLATNLNTLGFDPTGCVGGAACALTGGGPTIKQIAQGVAAGIPSIQACLTGAGTPCAGNPSISSIAGQISAGVDDALAGLGSAGNPNTLIGGTTAALNGTGQLLDGSKELFAGLQRAASGAGELASGLNDAFSGSGQITEGLRTAGAGTQSLEQSVYSINELGVKEVARSASEAAGEIGRQLALIEAQEARAATDSLMYGPPTSNQAETVVGGSGVVLTMESLDGRGADTAKRGIFLAVGLAALVGLALLGGMARKPNTS